jgi:hypothetical protein
MKKIFLLSVSMLAFGLWTGCGGGSAKVKMETSNVDYYRHAVSFTHPEGFFTRSEEAKDFIFNRKDGIAFVGKDFTLQVKFDTHGYQDFETFREAQKKQNSFLADVKGANHEGFVLKAGSESFTYVFPYSEDAPKDAVMLRFIPNEQKHPTFEEQNDSKKKPEFWGNCETLMKTQIVQDIVKSVKITGK